MNIYYRVSPYLSIHPNPLGKDKKKIVYECFNSFKKGLTDQKLFIIADNVPTDWYELFKGYPIIKSKTGNVETFHRQIDEACKLEGEKVFFVEDDYLWKEDAITKIEEALDTFGLVSPYDHPAHYTEERFKHQPKRMRLIKNQTWREAPSNTLTFATWSDIIKKNRYKIESFGIRDHEMFASLDHDLYVPVPSLATHLVTNLLAPNQTWI